MLTARMRPLQAHGPVVTVLLVLVWSCLGSGSTRTSDATGMPAPAMVQVQDWRAPDHVERGGPDADLVVRVGDIDNLGVGWPDGFDPFSGRSTTPHPYPFVAGDTVDVRMELARNQQTSESFARQLERDGKVDLYGINIDTDRATLRPDSEPTLMQVRALLIARPALRVVVAGHADAEGPDTHNQSLSERRAETVVAWLTDRGVSSGRLQSAGYGEAQPVADNGTAEGRGLNRRVEIRDAGR